MWNYQLCVPGTCVRTNPLSTPSQNRPAMSSFRSVLDVIPAQPLNMGGFHVKQPLPQGSLDQVDPFLLLHHARNRLEKGSRPDVEGVAPHPHRGFEPVTFIYKGGVHHRDSRGNNSIIEEGGVQWMTAGMGIVHSERPPRTLAEQGGEQEIIQLWINLPTEHKRVQPRYQGLQADQIPVLTSDEGSVVIQVVAGSLQEIEGPIETYSPVLALNAVFQSDGAFEFPIPESFNAFVYLLDGSVQINGERHVSGEHLIHFRRDGEAILIEALETTRILIMAGEPLNEPVVSSGPFVMNTTTEILEAMRDYRMGKMGVLVEEF